VFASVAKNDVYIAKQTAIDRKEQGVFQYISTNFLWCDPFTISREMSEMMKPLFQRSAQLELLSKHCQIWIYLG
jgi:hypothetical protein